ncbi:MAG: type VII toxin-antitoxin system HepT family RNase toxin [Fimbriimonas sp.]
MSDVLTNKIQSIQRCVRRAREEYQGDPDSFRTDYSRQDAAILNVIRACDGAIDLANHLIRIRKLGIPKSSAESFHLLRTEGIISPEIADQMRRMVGFRNLAVHQYSEIELDIVISVITKELDQLVRFAETIRGLS